MKTSFASILFLPAALALAVASTRAEGETSVLHFSNPSQPGRLVIQIGFGDVTVTGSDAKEVTITSEAPNRANPEPRKDGLRRLDSDDGYSATEADNVITVSNDSLFKGGRGGSPLTIVAPRTTSVSIERVGAGDIEIKDLAGDLEIHGTGGDVRLDGISGGVLVESARGDVSASFAAFPEQKPVSITVVSGDVSLRVPVQAKANVRFRTFRGEVLTDFSEKELVTRMEGGGSADAADAMDQAWKASADAQRAADAQEREKERAARDKARADAERARQRTETARNAQNVEPAVPEPPSPPKPPKLPRMPKIIPPMSGGKQVVGTLNGGGADLIVTSMSGTVTLRKAE